MKYVTTNDVHKALEKAASEGQEEYLIIKTLAETGLRVSELVHIEPRDLNDDKTIYVRGKGNKIRIIDIPGELYQLLKLFIKDRKIRYDRRIFSLDRSTVYRLTMKLIDKNPHAFRHGYAIHLLKRTRNIRYVQKQLGHSSLSRTQIYLQFMEYEQEKSQLSDLYS